MNAFIFPGQGSQKVGMGVELAEASAHAREVFEEVDEALNQKLSALMKDGPESELTMTANAQPAIMANSIATLRVLEKEFGVSLGDDVGIRVWDSTAELRYLVVPQRPEGTEGWSEEQLAAIVTRNSMIGTDRDLKVN